MRFLGIRLHDFRNVEFAELNFESDRCFLVGANGQGKSNLLEALGLVTALRSFRTQSSAVLARKGQSGYAAVYLINHDQQGETELELRSSHENRKVAIDGEKVGKLGHLLGRFPTVPLHSGDLMLLRGSPAERRRFLDLTLSAVDPNYYHALRLYHRGVAERNRLLKKDGSAAEFAAFEAEIAPHAVALAAKRQAGLARLRTVLCEVYEAISEAGEGPEITVQVSSLGDSVDAVRESLLRQRKRDGVMGSTQKGPHRDDFSLRLSIGGAREYASDGQQRGLCVALRIAQAKFFQERLGLKPVLLADDVLGELDPKRKAGFWRACPPELQVIATGTELPADRANWQAWRVESGSFSLF